MHPSHWDVVQKHLYPHLWHACLASYRALLLSCFQSLCFPLLAAVRAQPAGFLAGHGSGGRLGVFVCVEGFGTCTGVHHDQSCFELVAALHNNYACTGQDTHTHFAIRHGTSHKATGHCSCSYCKHFGVLTFLGPRNVFTGLNLF